MARIESLVERLRSARRWDELRFTPAEAQLLLAAVEAAKPVSDRLVEVRSHDEAGWLLSDAAVYGLRDALAALYDEQAEEEG